MTKASQAGMPHLRLTVHHHVGWLEFNRPPVNAFHQQMVQEVVDALHKFAANPSVRVIVFASALERYFSAGAELRTFVGIGKAGMATWCDLVHQIVYAMRTSSKPILAAIHGVAVGGGLEMTLHSDVRFAAQDAQLGQPEVNLNFIPPVGATQALARLLGRTRALKYLYDGALLSAEAALALGLVDELTPPDGLRETVQRYAETLCEKPPEALAGIRQAVIQGGGLSFDEGLRIERTVAIELAGTENFGEGVRAFLEKRKPQWRR
jgi:enoyl-CoA hydratase/carnithine racemase